MVKSEKIEFLGWKNCVKITNGKTEIIVTVDVGPRIISLTHAGKQNHMKVFSEHAGRTGDECFNAYGGHRLWHAPEVKGRTDTADNALCTAEMKKDGVKITAPADKAGIIRTMELTMNGEGEITVEHTLTNSLMFDVDLSVWALTQLEIGGLLAVPNSTRDTGLVGNRCISMWPYSAMNDRRVYWGDKFVTVSPDDKKTNPFKFGSTVDENYAVYFNFDQMIVKTFDYYYDAEYPNYQCNFESYTNHEFIEFETLSPMMTLEAGASVDSTEKWYVFDNVKKPERDGEALIARSVKDTKLFD